MGLTKQQLAARKAVKTRRKNRGKTSKSKNKSSGRSVAARKAWATRRRNQKVVGFYKDEKDRTRPITKSKAELKRKKLIKKPKKFKGVQPKGKKWSRTVTLKKGALSKLGYDPYTSIRSRHTALNKSIQGAGMETTRRRVQFLANVTPDGSELDEIYNEDLAWIKAKKKVDVSKSPNVVLKQGGASVYRLPAKRTWRFKSKSTPGKYYTVRLNQDDSLSCQCPGWIFSKYPKGCRHTREVHEKYSVG